MNKKLITSGEFFRNWAITGCNPEGNCIHTYIIGGNEDTYQNAINQKKIEIKSANSARYKWVSSGSGCIQCQALNGKVFDHIPNTNKLTHAGCKCKVVELEEEEEEEEDSVKYKWVCSDNGCIQCQALHDEVFDLIPDTESLAHPNCKCQIVEIAEEEAEALIEAKRRAIEQRDNAIKELNSQTTFNIKTGTPKDASQSIRNCAKYVTNALSKVGIDLRSIREKNYRSLVNKDYAYQYGNYLSHKNAGFIKIASGGGGYNPASYKPQKGDIAVFDRLRPTHEGHMQMYNGRNWVSDFNQMNSTKVQNMGAGFWAGNEYRAVQPSYNIYRHPRWQDR